MSKHKREWLYKRWLRDRSQPERVYVPEDLAPPARGLEGFDIRADGTFMEIDSSASDATLESPGNWQLKDNNSLVLTRADGKERIIQLIELSANRLTVA